MNRRKFLTFLAVAPLAIKANALEHLSKLIPAVPGAPSPIVNPLLGKPIINAPLGQYADYVSFSSFQLAIAIDKSVSDAAEQMSDRLGMNLSELTRQAISPS